MVDEFSRWWGNYAGGVTLKKAKPAYMYVDIHMYNTREEGHWSHLSEIWEWSMYKGIDTIGIFFLLFFYFLRFPIPKVNVHLFFFGKSNRKSRNSWFSYRKMQPSIVVTNDRTCMTNAGAMTISNELRRTRTIVKGTIIVVPKRILAVTAKHLQHETTRISSPVTCMDRNPSIRTTSAGIIQKTRTSRTRLVST